eukprot:243483_1
MGCGCSDPNKSQENLLLAEALYASAASKGDQNARIYRNEFELDAHQRLLDRELSPEKLGRFEYDRLMEVTESDITGALTDQTILFDSLVKIYSEDKHGYIDVAGILCDTALYFTSANNYQIWRELMDRTKINELIHMNTQITKEMADILTMNLDITHDEKLNESKIEPYFIGRTPHNVKLNIVLNEKPIESLSFLFHLDKEASHETIKSIKYIRIHSNDVVDIAIIDQAISYIFEDIPWIDQEVYNNSIIITLKRYHSLSIIDILNERMSKFVRTYEKDQKTPMYSTNVQISTYNKHKTVNRHEQCKTVNFVHTDQRIIYDSVEPLNAENVSYGFTLKASDRVDEGIQCQCDTNNTRFEWIAHLDYIMYKHRQKSSPRTRTNLYDRAMFSMLYDILYSKSLSLGHPDELNLNDACNVLVELASAGDDVRLQELLREMAMKLQLYFVHKQYPARTVKHAVLILETAIGNTEMRQLLYDKLRIAQTRDKMMNDFGYQDNKDGDDASPHFNFGIYLHYWEVGYVNSVNAKYSTLKDELLNNKHSPINEKWYYDLYEKSLTIYEENVYRADAIGVNNKKFKIPAGSVMTINHFIAVKSYTDFTKLQKEFKTHCRRQRRDESLESIVIRNQEIAHWCRYLKEVCTFYGEIMDEKMVVYTGLATRLMFNSMKQHFECPLSTTVDISVAHQFAEGNRGIILKLKRANNKTRYFNVCKLSHFNSEDERLFMGPSLQIVDIIIAGASTKRYIGALNMFEQIINGYIIYDNKAATKRLISLLDYVLEPTYMEQIIDLPSLKQFVDEEQYDTDSLVCDIEHNLISNVAKRVSADEMMMIVGNNQSVRKLRTKKTPPKYICDLFVNYVWNLKKDTIWLNEQELMKYEQIKERFMGSGQLFDRFGVDKVAIQYAQQYEWNIAGDEYQTFLKKKPREYIQSPSYTYTAREFEIAFHFRSNAKLSDSCDQCAFFLHLESMDDSIEGISIELDVLCDKKQQYRHLLSTQWLTPTKKYCGFQTFPYDDLKKNTSVKWKVALKVHGLQFKTSDVDVLDDEMMMDEDKFNIKMVVINKHNNNDELMHLCRALYQKNIRLMKKNVELSETVEQLKDGRQKLVKSKSNVLIEYNA